VNVQLVNCACVAVPDLARLLIQTHQRVHTGMLLKSPSPATIVAQSKAQSHANGFSIEDIVKQERSKFTEERGKESARRLFGQ